jgi:hypothetical protein
MSDNKRPENLRRLYLDLRAGSTRLTGVLGFNEVFLRHPNFSIELEAEEYYNREMAKCKRDGIPTSAEVLKRAIELGSWTQESEEEIKGLEFQVINLEKMKLKHARSMQ